MIWIIIIAVLLICFGGVLLFGAPYLPTLKPQVQTALELADLKKGDTLIELGCGDGRVMIAAAKQGINVIGYELNPLLAAVAWLRTRPYRSSTSVKWGNFWKADWPEADAIFVFLIPRLMAKLNKKVIQYPHKPVKLVSFAFDIKQREADKQVDGVFLYRYK